MKFIYLLVGCFLILSCNKNGSEEFGDFSVRSFYEGNNKFTLYQNKEIAFILNNTNDTVFKNAEPIDIVEINDINQDNFPDVVVSYISNYEVYDIGLYDVDTKLFRVIKNFDSPPQKIPHSEFYYTYGSDGCSDLNWHSDLIMIEGRDVKTYSRIKAIYCNGVSPQGTFIYNIKDGTEVLFQKAPLYTDKFIFIDEYWKNLIQVSTSKKLKLIK